MAALVRKQKMLFSKAIVEPPQEVHASSATSPKPLAIESSNRYRHQALDTSTQQIRLIKLRSEQRGPPACDIAIFELSSAPPFVALSYTWGPPSPQFDIIVNGKPLSIRENLFQFLKVFMATTERDWAWKPLRDNYLWIDQICIDQSSIRERNHQVGMMASIYSGCFDTIIWLGSIHKDPDAPCIIKKIGQSSVPEEDLLQAVASITGNDYFSRLWIVQEIILSKKKRVLCSHPSVGAVWVDWVNLTFVAHHSKYRAPSIAANYLVRQLPQDMITLFHAMSIFSQSRCQDPRDKVYGLMGLVQEEERLTIDYAKSLEELFVDVAMVVNRQSGRLKVRDMLVDLGRSWDIFSETLDAFITDVWDRLPYDEFSKKESQERGPPLFSAMGFVPNALNGNTTWEWKELRPYIFREGRNTLDFELNTWTATEDCWWYEADEIIYDIHGLVSLEPLRSENTKPPYYGKRARRKKN